VARVGRASLHRSWVDRGMPRDWDLLLSPYQPIAPQPDLDCMVGDVIPGAKLAGVRELLTGWDGWREYDHVWLPDDDILADQRTLSRMFEVARALGLDLFAPALREDSYYAHFSTMRNARFHGRWVGFVEIMMPGFSTAALDRLLPTLDETATGWGWGLDSVWPKLLGYENVAIIDGTPVVHTRPVGQLRDADLARQVLAESDALLERYRCDQMHTTFGAFGPRPAAPRSLTRAAPARAGRRRAVPDRQGPPGAAVDRGVPAPTRRVAGLPGRRDAGGQCGAPRARGDRYPVDRVVGVAPRYRKVTRCRRHAGLRQYGFPLCIHTVLPSLTQ